MTHQRTNEKIKTTRKEKHNESLQIRRGLLRRRKIKSVIFIVYAVRAFHYSYYSTLWTISCLSHGRARDHL